MTFTLTNPTNGKPPSLATDDRYMIRRCDKCGGLYRTHGFSLTEYAHIAEMAYAEQARYIGHSPGGTCGECRE